MTTVLTRSIAEAAEFIRSGGIVAFPTETVYGLGADVFNVDAVARIFEAKQRPPDNPLIAHISERGQIELLAAEISIDASALIEAFFPGPLTLVVPKTSRVPLIATAGLETIGVRMPSAKLAREFLKACGTPVAAPSANLSGRPSPTTWQAVLEDLDGRIDCILQGEATDHGLESTVVDCTIMPPVILRLGSLSIEALRSMVPEIGIHRQDAALPPRSPGLRYKHYAPNARVVLVDSPSEIGADTGSAYIGLTEPVGEFAETMVCGSVEDYAHTVFAFFRKCDKAGIDTIYCQMVSESGIGAALMDRLRRAASH
ncbi:MAG: threonylcarbamoyl-AMP synthase [Acidobacteria bacterium]|nr:threonylcarbamoyl-AMP synthase [Acidobacteriota bacterium]